MTRPWQRYARILRVALALVGVLVLAATLAQLAFVMTEDAAADELEIWRRRAVPLGASGGPAQRIALSFALPIAIPIVAYVALVPLYLALRCRSYAIMALLQVALLVGAAIPAVTSIVRILTGG